MKADDTAERIKRAALERFVEVGFGSATVDEIAANAGVGVATLYRRWPDKAALANALMIDYLDVLQAILEPVTGGTRKGRFLELWERFWHQAQAEPDLLLFVEAQAHAGFMTDDVAVRKDEVAEQLIESLRDLVGADPTTAISMLVGTVTAVWRGGLDVDPDDLGQRLWIALRST